MKDPRRVAHPAAPGLPDARSLKVVPHVVVIGAGAAVIRDIPDCVVAHGVPAVVRHARHAGERYLGNITAGVSR